MLVLVVNIIRLDLWNCAWIRRLIVVETSPEWQKSITNIGFIGTPCQGSYHCFIVQKLWLPMTFDMVYQKMHYWWWTDDISTTFMLYHSHVTSRTPLKLRVYTSGKEFGKDLLSYVDWEAGCYCSDSLLLNGHSPSKRFSHYNADSLTLD